MDFNGLVGNIKDVTPTTTSNLVNTELYELITQESHGTDFSFNILRILQEGAVEKQSHVDEHAVFVIDGKCRIQLGEKWITAEKGNYLYIPPNMTHSFSNVEKKRAEILILKKRQTH